MSIYDKIEKATTTEELTKLATLNELKSALKSYHRSKEYHAKYNAKNAEIIKAYKLEHPEA